MYGPLEGNQKIDIGTLTHTVLPHTPPKKNHCSSTLTHFHMKTISISVPPKMYTHRP